eukprot:PRCOL_00003652-RA
MIAVIISGAPASGKGTQCELISAKYGLTHISAGDLLRAAVAEGTPAGAEAKKCMDAGQLVPNEIIVDMIVDRLAQPDCEAGWLLDGYPRSSDQASALEEAGIRPNAVLQIDVPDDILVDRVVGRRSDPETGKIYHMTFFPPPEDIVDRLVQRSDDTEEKCKARLEVFHSNNQAVLEAYDGLITHIDGDRAKDVVFADIDKALAAAA